MGTLSCYPFSFAKADNCCDFLFNYMDHVAFEKGSALKKKTLLLWEQILFLKELTPI